MVSLRTPEGKQKYKEYLQSEKSDVCPLCEKAAIKSFIYWKVTENNFPYDKIAKTHHMLVPLRHVAEEQLSLEELVELKKIKAEFVSPDYDWMLEATNKNKSIPGHFHLHLIVGK